MASSKHLRGLWWIIFISLHIINSNGKTEEQRYQYTISQGKAQNIYKGSVYAFVQEPLSWNQAHTSCEKQDGNLLRTLNDEIQKYLQSLNTGNGPWWISQNLMYKYSTSGVVLTKTTINFPLNNNGSITNNQNQVACSYMVKDPFQVVSTPNCSAKYGSLCVQDSVSHLKSSKVKSRPQRDLLGTLSTLTGEQSTTQLIQNAKDTLKDLETTTEELTFDNKMTYLQSIYNNIKLTTPNDTIELSEIVNCTAAMLLYTQECQLDNMDELEQLISLAGLIYQRAMHNNGTILMNLPTGTIYVTRQKSSALGGMRLGSVDGGYCQLPALSAMSGQLPAGDINVQVFQFKDNPLQDLSNESITGATLSFTLQTDNSSVKLSNLPGNIEIYLPWADAPVPEVVNIAWKQGYAVTSGFNITDTDMTVILSAIPNQNITLNFMLVSPLEPNSSCWNQSVSVTYKNGYRWLIHPEMIKGIKGSWSVMISPINYTSSQTLSFQVSVFVTKCLYWDTDLGDWSRNGCMVGPNTWPNLTQCLCNHTTFFGSSFFVMPNQVDLSQTAALFATVKENYIVVVLLSCFFAVYLMVVMWAWYSDRKALRTRKMTLLEDNHPCARYNYLINVQTGHRRRAGTTAKVKVTLNFSEGQSEPYNLSDPEKPVFERGGVDVFLLSLPFFLGELQGIEILHDNSGGSPDWYLGKVMVQDLQTQEVTHFLCSTWLRGANCSRTFNSAKKNEVASFGNIFQTRTSSGFRDEHIWVSIVDPPRRSPFTRVQRVSCCMSLLLCTMAINIMFWNIPTDAESPVILEIGSLKLTWQEFMVAIESGLFMFPINILIITIFRHIKPRILPNKDKSGGSNNAKQASIVSMNTIVKETITLLIHLSKHPKNMLPPNEIKPEASGDLFWALNKVNDVIEVMQVESVGDGHWVYCSHFVLFSLSHISLLLEHVGEKGCFLNEELRQARGTIRLLLKKAEMTSSRYNLESPQDFQVQKKKQGWWLPWWFVFIGWFLLFTMSGISTFFTLLYGFQYGKASSIQWVITLMLSLVQSIFILQPLKVILVAIFFAMILRPVAVEENEEVELLLQEQKQKCAEYSGRPVS